ncbi:MAG TPA: sulfatase [Anaerolineales bacterium]|nr:sulfatase [Anaerolineales bacterium]
MTGISRKIFHPLTIIVAMMVLLSCAPAVPGTLMPLIEVNPPEGYKPYIFDIEVESTASQQRLSDSRPNIIVIMTDDQPDHTIAYMPTVMKELVPNGVNFTNAFVTTPLCCPSRASILSGEYAHNHQVYTNQFPEGGAEKFDATETVATWMKDAGYRTAYYGKYLNGYERLDPIGIVPPGWDEWGVFLGQGPDADEGGGNLEYFFNFTMSENGTVVEYPRSKSNFGTDVVTIKSVDFINQARNEPFFLFVGYYSPHSPYISAPRHRDSTFRVGTGWDWIQYRPPNFNEENIRDKPEYLQDISPLSEGEVDTAHKQILRSLLSVDDGVASILNALDKTGLKENTVVVFLSDNGMTLGDHRFGVDKNCVYEACVKIPFILYAPGLVEARSDDHLVANIDLVPTFIEWAGGEIPSSVDGLSFADLLVNPNAKWRDEILLEHWPTEGGVGSMIPEFYAVRTVEWKYVEYVTGDKELYDLVNDPYELENLAGKRKYREIEVQLAARLAELKKD